MTTTHWRVALIVWMGAIFIFSTSLLSAENTAKHFGDLNYLARKFAHIAEYAILVYLWFRSLWTKLGRFISCVRWSMLLSILYAMLDEWHQTFVPSRDGIWLDVVWDSIGIIAMGLILWSAKRTGKEQRILGSIGGQEPVSLSRE